MLKERLKCVKCRNGFVIIAIGDNDKKDATECFICGHKYYAERTTDEHGPVLKVFTHIETKEQ